jgi:hypothetical protein
VLEAIPPATRASVIDAIEMLLTAFVSRGCCAERRGTPRAGTSD